jgi:hypothetical protein
MNYGTYFGRLASCVVLAGLAAGLTVSQATLAVAAGQREGGVRVTNGDGLTAFDDGEASLCTQTIRPEPTAIYHIAISDPKLHRFADTGACLYVTDQTGTLRGDVVVMSGSAGTTALAAFNSDYTGDGFRVTNIAFDTAWEDTDPTDVLPGSFLNASNKIAAAANWIYAKVHLDASGQPAGKNLAFCGQGSSGGSSGIDYQISHDGEYAKFDHIILIAASPFTRLDIGCNASSAKVSAPTWCAWTPNPASPVYGAKDASNIGTWSHDANCGSADPPAASLAAWEAQSIVSPGEKLSYTNTSISVIVCQNEANPTQPLATYRFGNNGERVMLDLTKDPSFGMYPHFYCDADGVTEKISTTGHDWVVSEMSTSCFPKH